MALTIDWPNKIINIPKSYMVLIQSTPSYIYQLDMDVLRKDLRALEASADGMPFPPTHEHQPPVTISGAVLVRVVSFINGYTVEFEDDQYRVYVVGANTNIGDITIVNQVSVSTSNSAGLQDLTSLQAASFNGGVAVNVSSSYSGTTFPIGTRDKPVNNFTDALSIAVTRSFNSLFVLSDVTVSSDNFSKGYVFKGDNILTNTITLESGAIIPNCEFNNITVTGVLDGNNIFRMCRIRDIDYTNGLIFQCALEGTITLGGSAQASILDSWSNEAGDAVITDTPEINMGGSGNSLALRNYTGNIRITNYSGGGDIGIDMASGSVIIDSTVTAGTIIVRGTAKVVDNSTGVATVVDATINGAVAAIQVGINNAIGLIASKN